MISLGMALNFNERSHISMDLKKWIQFPSFTKRCGADDPLWTPLLIFNNLLFLQDSEWEYPLDAYIVGLLAFYMITRSQLEYTSVTVRQGYSEGSHHLFLLAYATKLRQSRIQYIWSGFESHVMQTFKHSIPRHLLNQESFTPLLRKAEQYRKMLQLSTNASTKIFKLFDEHAKYAVSLRRSQLNDRVIIQRVGQAEYFKKLLQIYGDDAELQMKLTESLNHLLCQLSDSNSHNYVDFTNDLLDFQQQLRSYQVTEASAADSLKKYQKAYKLLRDSIKQYNDSFVEAKLIYNMEEKVKRYSTCQSCYKIANQEYEAVQAICHKMQKKKSEIISAYGNLERDFQQREVDSNIKFYKYLAYANREFSENLRQRIRALMESKNLLEDNHYESLLNCKLIVKNHSQQIEQAEKSLREHLQDYGNYNFEYFRMKLTSVFNTLQTKLHSQTYCLKKIQEFHYSLYRSFSKAFTTQVKQFLDMLARHSQNYKQLFLPQSSFMINNVKGLMANIDKAAETMMKIMVKRMQKICHMVAQVNSSSKILCQEINKNAERMIDNFYVLTRQSLQQKYKFLAYLIEGFDQKFQKWLMGIRIEFNSMVNDYQIGLTEMENSCKIYTTNANNDGQKILTIKRMRRSSISKSIVEEDKAVNKFQNTPFQELNRSELKQNITFEHQHQKMQEFLKLKKPIRNTEKSDNTKNLQGKESYSPCSPTREQALQMNKRFSLDLKGVESPTVQKNHILPQKNEKQPKKNNEFFLRSKISFYEQESYLKSFTCALADKIILQGKLFVTTHRICFFSNFNSGNVFFGGTFIEVPKKDIISLEKRKSGLLFDNSISLQTVNGKLLFTSFFRRNNAFKLIHKIAELSNQQLICNPSEEQSPQSLKANVKSESSSEDYGEEKQDDMPESSISERNIKIESMLTDFPYKLCLDYELDCGSKHLTAFQILKTFLIDTPINYGNKRYACFTEYFRKQVSHQKDLRIGNYEPCLGKFLNSCIFGNILGNIKENCPEKFCKTTTSTIPTVKSSIPFMPKFIKSVDQNILYPVSKHKWIIESTIKSSGAPYTDCFEIRLKTVCESTNQGSCSIKVHIFVNFIKNTMMRSIIQSRSEEESTIQLRTMYNEYKRYLQYLSEQSTDCKRKTVENPIENPTICEHQDDESQIVQAKILELQSKVNQQQKIIEQYSNRNAELQLDLNRLKIRDRYALIFLFLLYVGTVFWLIV